ncbi:MULTISPECIES: glycosyltransferase family 4 protein [unclassified Rathayibacter]|uniref:glycosyltransferase family 4 protein n=1 Tax=unclassified Rathayibacter TaxID=2609250 RepID=UPI00188CF05C|nr:MULTISPECIES: glycosyltransferase family 4 protein [unclassified Rathayibacter]MBF4461884.1 glycosyltransferase family 4 protein [Rathayibacter sp. VKM Ac-2879]MBF4504073.1 glycosyltransferase family 4 protein [Rathayibacter sp. VKM Ac-2878]
MALESWHAAPLERVWREQGHRVTVVTGEPAGFPGAEVHGIPLGRLVGLASRLGVGSSALSAFTRRARRLLEPLRPELVVALPGTARELAGLAPTTVVLADGGHVRALAERLAPRAANRVPLPVARCEAEYRRATVVVPSAVLAAGFPSSAEVVVVAPGLPATGPSAPTAPDGPLRLAAVGAPAWSRGVDRLDAIARLEATDYVTVVGAGGRIDGGLAAGLRFVGAQDRDGTAEIFRHSHAYLHLARTVEGAAEGLEALACGLPVLATESSALAGLCAEGAGVVVPDDASREDLAAALERLRTEWASLSRRAHELAGERPWSVAAEQILALAEDGAGVR